MTVADDLATLREALSVYHDIRGGETYAEQRAEQSQALDVLARELERLKRERDSARSANKELAAERDAERARADAAEAEAERLRAVIRDEEMEARHAARAEAEAARLRDGLRDLMHFMGRRWFDGLPVDLQDRLRALLAEDGAA